MAYSASGLTRLNGDSNGSLWRYTTTDAIATVIQLVILTMQLICLMFVIYFS